jgi:hypothetical protein
VCAAAPGADARPAATTANESMTLLTLPSAVADDPAALLQAQGWVDGGEPGQGSQSLLIALHGVQIVWSPARAAIVAPVDRLDAARGALVEFAYYEGELRDLERCLADGWPRLEADSPLAFEFDEKGIARRTELARGFQQALALRSRLARLTPQIQRPLVHPPTLASQIGERLRERTRLAERVEFADGQLAVFEHVYEMCSQRASEFLQSRKGHNLEWIIIVLLAAQTLLLLFERLTSLGSSTP